MAWKKTRDPLFRGDDAAGVGLPDPKAKLSIVAHVLYLDGKGRASPFQSSTESEDVATRFAGAKGHVYRTSVPKAEARKVVHLGQVELKRLLRGKGQGKAAWPSALEVMQARKYVELWAEHLLDFSNVPDVDVTFERDLLGREVSRDVIADIVMEIYEP